MMTFGVVSGSGQGAAKALSPLEVDEIELDLDIRAVKSPELKLDPLDLAPNRRDANFSPIV